MRSADKIDANFCRRGADTGSQTRVSLPPQRRYRSGHPGVGGRENGLMRITNGIIQRSALANLQLNIRRVLEAQEASTTGKRIRAVSNDPIGASQVRQSDESLRALEQYKRNIASATAHRMASTRRCASWRSLPRRVPHHHGAAAHLCVVGANGDGEPPRGAGERARSDEIREEGDGRNGAGPNEASPNGANGANPAVIPSAAPQGRRPGGRESQLPR